jgi:hypothetical protein
MGMVSREAVRQALIQRVSRKVSGHGVARRSIEGAVDRVLAELPAGLSRTNEPARSDAPPRVVVLSAASAPDLASRARRLLEREGVSVLEAGTATSGRHTVVSFRVPGSAVPALERVATELGASVSVLDEADARQVRT